MTKARVLALGLALLVQALGRAITRGSPMICSACQDANHLACRYPTSCTCQHRFGAAKVLPERESTPRCKRVLRTVEGKLVPCLRAADHEGQHVNFAAEKWWGSELMEFPKPSGVR